MLIEMRVKEFSDILSSNAPAPGGGSVAALSGMLGADLLSMVCRLTIGKDGYESYQDELATVLGRSQALSGSLRQRVDLDTEAFNGVMAAFKLPKATDDEKASRGAAIQQGYKNAIQSPLAIARECEEVLALTARLLGKSNSNALSDLGVAAQQALAGLEGAIMNVKINMPSIKDEAFLRQTASEVEMLRENGRRSASAVSSYVTEKIG